MSRSDLSHCGPLTYDDT